MNTKACIQPTFRNTVSALVLLLTLVFGATATQATAQPSASDEELGSMIEQMEDSLSNASVRAKLSTAQWHIYGDRLADALASGHEGLCEGALRMTILYGDYLGLQRPAVFNVVRIYRNHKDDRLRRMAVVALGKIQDAWAMDFLKRSVRFEQSPSVRQTILAVLAEYNAKKLGPAKVGS